MARSLDGPKRREVAVFRSGLIDRAAWGIVAAHVPISHPEHAQRKLSFDLWSEPVFRSGSSRLGGV